MWNKEKIFVFSIWKKIFFFFSLETFFDSPLCVFLGINYVNLLLLHSIPHSVYFYIQKIFFFGKKKSRANEWWRARGVHKRKGYNNEKKDKQLIYVLFMEWRWYICKWICFRSCIGEQRREKIDLEWKSEQISKRMDRWGRENSFFGKSYSKGFWKNLILSGFVQNFLILNFRKCWSKGGIKENGKKNSKKNGKIDQKPQKIIQNPEKRTCSDVWALSADCL